MPEVYGVSLRLGEALRLPFTAEGAEKFRREGGGLGPLCPRRYLRYHCLSIIDSESGLQLRHVVL
jgi:hypothetical protein